MRLRSSTLPVLAALVMAVALLGVPAGTVAPVGAESSHTEALGNAALASAGATVSASGSEGDGSYGWTPDKAIDGITSGPAGQDTSRWSSNYSDSAWLTVHPAEPVVIDHVNIYWERACPLKYKLQVSVDGRTWVDASGVLEPTCDVLDTQRIGADADPATAYRHVRMQTIERRPIGGRLYGVSLWEMEVWDMPEPAETPLVPQPVAVDRPEGAAPFVIDSQTSVLAPGDARPVADQLAELLRRSTGYRIPVSGRDPDADISLTVDPDADFTVGGAEPTEESYLLDVSADEVEITATTAHGAFNGMQTLRQLLPAWGNAPREVNTSWEIPAIHIEDAPRFSYRGVMLDVARSFQDVDAVKRYIDTLAQLKMSVLHLHLADDQGWRIEITNKGKDADDPIDYHELTARSGSTSRLPAYREELGLTGYYTQQEYREIVEYARDRFVTIVPEVDIPGHTNAALHAIPELNTGRSLPAPDPETGVVDWNGTGSVGYSALDEQHEPTYQFVKHVFSQLAEMTGGPYVHIGGDESHAMGHSRYVDFVQRAVPEVREATGVGTIGWTEYAEAGLDEGPGYWDGSVVQYWVGSGDWVRDFIAKGGKAVVSAAGGSYLDQKYDPSTPIGLTWACSGDCDFPQYYSWDPTTTVSGGISEDGVLGVEAPLWSETVRGEEQALYLTLPRAAAVLETGWTPAARKDVGSFAERLGGLGAHLTVAGTNFYESRRATWPVSVAGTDVKIHPRATTYDVGLVAAPGTKASEDGTRIISDTSTADGDPASNSALTEPLTATLECGDDSFPVTFSQEQPRDNLHGAELYTASVQHTFRDAASCVLTPSVGQPAVVEVSWRGSGDHGGRGEAERPHGRPFIAVGHGPSVDAGTWVPMTLRGFAPDELVDISVDDEMVYRLRTDDRGEFHRHALIPRNTYDGEHTVTATQGDRTAADDVQVVSDLKPLPNLIDQASLSVHDVDSEETIGEDGAASNAIDGDPDTIWHTQWLEAQPGYPHHIALDLGAEYDVTGLQYLQRINAANGRMKDYEISVSTDGETWTEPVAAGTFTADTHPQTVEFPPTRGRYVRLTGLSSINGANYGGAAEINIGGVLG